MTNKEILITVANDNDKRTILAPNIEEVQKIINIANELGIELKNQPEIYQHVFENGIHKRYLVESFLDFSEKFHLYKNIEKFDNKNTYNFLQYNILDCIGMYPEMHQIKYNQNANITTEIHFYEYQILMTLYKELTEKNSNTMNFKFSKSKQLKNTPFNVLDQYLICKLDKDNDSSGVAIYAYEGVRFEEFTNLLKAIRFGDENILRQIFWNEFYMYDDYNVDLEEDYNKLIDYVVYIFHENLETLQSYLSKIDYLEGFIYPKSDEKSANMIYEYSLRLKELDFSKLKGRFDQQNLYVQLTELRNIINEVLDKNKDFSFFEEEQNGV